MIFVDRHWRELCVVGVILILILIVLLRYLWRKERDGRGAEKPVPAEQDRMNDGLFSDDTPDDERASEIDALRRRNEELLQENENLCQRIKQKDAILGKNQSQVDQEKQTAVAEAEERVRKEYEKKLSDRETELLAKYRARLQGKEQEFASEKRRMEDEKRSLIKRYEEESARKDEELALRAKESAEMLSRFWPNPTDGNADLTPVFRAWVTEMRDAETVSAPVMGMLSQLFCWKSAVADGALKRQYDALAEFSRNFIKWCASQNKSTEETWELADKFAAAFNENVFPKAEIASEKRYRVFVPEISSAYNARQMFPSFRGEKAGSVSKIESWGIVETGKSATVQKRADVVLK